MTDSRYQRIRVAISSFVNGIFTRAKSLSAADHAVFQKYLVILLILVAIVTFRDVGRYSHMLRGGVLDTYTGETWWPGDSTTHSKPPLRREKKPDPSGVDFSGVDLE
jgi:hypothetical protein